MCKIHAFANPVTYICTYNSVVYTYVHAYVHMYDCQCILCLILCMYVCTYNIINITSKINYAAINHVLIIQVIASYF